MQRDERKAINTSHILRISYQNENNARKNLYGKVYTSFIHNSQKPETIQVTFNMQMIKQTDMSTAW